MNNRIARIVAIGSVLTVTIAAVAKASELHIEQISYRNRVWDAASSEEGWRPREDADSSAGAEQAVLVRLATKQ